LNDVEKDFRQMYASSTRGRWPDSARRFNNAKRFNMNGSPIYECAEQLLGAVNEWSGRAPPDEEDEDVEPARKRSKRDKKLSPLQLYFSQKVDALLNLKDPS
jgi:hypothetical protein